jgi:hypothetical protein
MRPDFIRDRLAPWALLVACALVAVLNARPYAGSWNDGSRLAAVESLADRGTFAIEDSVFVTVPAELSASATPPYDPGQPILAARGTLDRLKIGDHFYSDKPALISLAMAAPYRLARACGLPPAAERPDLFCRGLTLLFSGSAYLLAVACVLALGRELGLGGWWRLAWAAAFALATVAPAYTEYVNNHIMLLAVGAAACWQFAVLAREAGGPGVTWWRPWLLGALGGLGYNLDLAAGQVLAAVSVLAVAVTTRRVLPAAACGLASVPWAVAQLGLNYMLGGVWKPINTVMAYQDWPGCPFSEANATGFLRHTPGGFVVYALEMLFGKPGFLNHNLPLLLLVPSAWWLVRSAGRDRLVVGFAAAWAGGTWLLYAAFSNNFSGASLTVRWFVPLLAPGFAALAVLLRDHAAARPCFAALAGWGAVLAVPMAAVGPFTARMAPFYWPVLGLALATWGVVAWRQFRRPAEPRPTPATVPAAWAA